MDLSASPEVSLIRKSDRSGFHARLSNRIAAADPAFSRLRLALRAVLSLALSGGVLALVATQHALPPATYGLAVVLSFVGSLAVRERTASAQLLTRVHAAWAAAASALLAGGLAPDPVAADIGFLCVIFVSVYVRRFGPRWFAVGMVSFLAYFIGDYLKPPPSQIGWIVFGTATALAASHFVSTVLLPDDPERDFRRAMTTIDHRINLILRQLLRMVDDAAPLKDNDRTLRAHLSDLREIMLMAEGFISQGRTGALSAQGAASDLATALFDLQLAVERLVRARHIALPHPPMVRALLDEHGCLLRQAPEAEPGAGGPTDIAAQLLLRLRDARVRINLALGAAPSPAFKGLVQDTGKAGKDSAPAKDDGGDTASWPRFPLSLHRPIQVTLACALALGAGHLLSPTRWYWAVITAFIVFNNTRSRADTALRALHRSVGTLGGLFVGTAVATVLQGHVAASGIAIPVLFFLAFYFLQTSYGLMMFFVTIALALLYGLMGMFTPQLLLVRLEETVVGSIAGALVAFLVFPVSATREVENALTGFLDALEELIAAAGKRMRAQEDAGDLMGLSRTLDRRYSDLAAAARPLSAPWRVVTRFGPVRHALLPFMGSAHWGRVLAQTLDSEHPLPLAEVRWFDTLAGEMQNEISALRATGADLFLRGDSRRIDPEKAPPAAMRAASGNEKAGHALEAIRDLMKWLNDRAGAGAARVG